MQYTNQLIHETSPYLLQHAHNPVNWLPYGKPAFEEAHRMNKPLLISIGYSSCHWCHVMEHESFEDEGIARIMNDNFVCVKVDREERPDVDHAYMDAVQQIHGSGGWPLNCFVLPDGRPFWGGTYFRPEQWKQLLSNVSALYHTRLADLQKQASDLAEGVDLQNSILSEQSQSSELATDFESVFSILQANFDSEKGGMKGAPKFPLPMVWNFLLDYGTAYSNNNAMQMVGTTLQNMACGGIYDQAGGGFARYSTDSDWKVPHFEKMLYDNAQLVSLYSKAYRITGNVAYKGIVEQTIEFIIRELMAPEGVFYSALDADSEGEEGLYYTWTKEQFTEALGSYSGLAAEYYKMGAEGLWEGGRNILLRTPDNDLFAKQHFLSADELASLTRFCTRQLLKIREQRPRPTLDDKMLISWNSLMISALVDASVAFGRDEDLNLAIRTGRFIINNLKRKDGGLFHTWKEGKSRVNAFLDDYAFTCLAFLDLYSATADENWLHEAGLFTKYVIEHFYDANSGFFWYSEKDIDHIFARKIEIYDGVIPSGNSVIANVLFKLGIFLDRKEYVEKALHMLSAMEERFSRYPAAYANWASLALSHHLEPHVVAVSGKDAVSFIKELKREDLTGALILGSIKESYLPYFANRLVEGKTLIYICKGTQCQLPVETVEEALQILSV